MVDTCRIAPLSNCKLGYNQFCKRENLARISQDYYKLTKWGNPSSIHLAHTFHIFPPVAVSKLAKASWLAARSFDDRLSPELERDVEQIISNFQDADQ